MNKSICEVLQKKKVRKVRRKFTERNIASSRCECEKSSWEKQPTRRMYRLWCSRPLLSSAVSSLWQSAVPPLTHCAGQAAGVYPKMVCTEWKACELEFAAWLSVNHLMALYHLVLFDCRKTLNIVRERNKHRWVNNSFITFSHTADVIITQETMFGSGPCLVSPELGSMGTGGFRGTGEAEDTFAGFMVANSRTYCNMSARGYLVGPEP